MNMKSVFAFGLLPVLAACSATPKNKTVQPQQVEQAKANIFGCNETVEDTPLCDGLASIDPLVDD